MRRVIKHVKKMYKQTINNSGKAHEALKNLIFDTAPKLAVSFKGDTMRPLILENDVVVLETVGPVAHIHNVDCVENRKLYGLMIGFELWVGYITDVRKSALTLKFENPEHGDIQILLSDVQRIYKIKSMIRNF